MSERRFVIKEVDDREAIFHPYEIAINESELRQRAVLMFNAKWTCKEDIRIDILLHGDGEKGEEWTPKQLAKHLKDHPEDIVVIDKPSPAPTRAEWEAWVDNMPVTLDCKLDVLNTHDFRAWFRAMPIVPKE